MEDDTLPHSKLPGWAQPLLCGVALGVTVHQFSHKLLPRFATGAQGLMQSFDQALAANDKKLKKALSKEAGGETSKEEEDEILCMRTVIERHTGRCDKTTQPTSTSFTTSASKESADDRRLETSDPDDDDPDDAEIEALESRLREAKRRKKERLQPRTSSRVPECLERRNGPQAANSCGADFPLPISRAKPSRTSASMAAKQWTKCLGQEMIQSSALRPSHPGNSPSRESSRQLPVLDALATTPSSPRQSQLMPSGRPAVMRAEAFNEMTQHVDTDLEDEGSHSYQPSPSFNSSASRQECRSQTDSILPISQAKPSRSSASIAAKRWMHSLGREAAQTATAKAVHRGSLPTLESDALLSMFGQPLSRTCPLRRSEVPSNRCSIMTADVSDEVNHLSATDPECESPFASQSGAMTPRQEVTSPSSTDQNIRTLAAIKDVARELSRARQPFLVQKPVPGAPEWLVHWRPRQSMSRGSPRGGDLTFTHCDGNHPVLRSMKDVERFLTNLASLDMQNGCRPPVGFDASRLKDRLYYLNAVIKLWWPASRCGPDEEPGYYDATVVDVAEDPCEPGMLQHFLTFADHSEIWMRLDNEEFETVKREKWLTSGHAFIGRQLVLVVKKETHVSPVIAWLPADETEGDPILFKVELEPNDFHDLELHEVEDAFRKYELLKDSASSDACCA